MDAFAYYLNLNGFKVSVITLKEHSEDLNYELKDGISVYRLSNKVFIKRPKFYAGEPKWKHLVKVIWNLTSARFDPLPESGWMKAVSAQLSKLNQEKKIDLVISSFSPVESHLAALNFLNKNKDVKWIADMRDEMSMNKLIPLSAQRKLARIEREIALRADAITSVSVPILIQFRKLMPEVNNFEEIRNGYNHEFLFNGSFNNKFTIVYAGTFYGLRKPTTFFAGLQKALNHIAFDFEIVFVGTHHNFNIPQEFIRNCRFITKVTQDEAIQLMAGADANLLVLPEIETKGVYSGKIFDYISVMKPIIAVVDQHDVAANLIRDLNAGFVADFNDEQAISFAITSAYQLWMNKEMLPVEREQVKLLHRKHQVKKLELLIDKILKQ
jgi:glycosyltransferase involved in cell wall biosynthesis